MYIILVMKSQVLFKGHLRVLKKWETGLKFGHSRLKIMQIIFSQNMIKQLSQKQNIKIFEFCKIIST